MAAKKLILHSNQSMELTGLLDTKYLKSLSGKRVPSIGYMPSQPDPRHKYFKEVVRYYERCGFQSPLYLDPSGVDARDLHKEPLKSHVRNFFGVDAIHLSGGNCSLFLSAIHESSLTGRILEFVDQGGVLLGVSAGAMIMGPSIGVATLLAEKNLNTDGTLGLVDFEVLPHWQERKVSAESVARYAKQVQRLVYPISDGECIVVNGTKVTHLASNGAVRVPIQYGADIPLK